MEVKQSTNFLTNLNHIQLLNVNSWNVEMENHLKFKPIKLNLPAKVLLTYPLISITVNRKV